MDASASAHMPLTRPVLGLRGVGPERTAQLGRLGVQTVSDLLLLRPRRYEDRRRILPIAAVRLHEPVTVRGKIVALGIKRFAQRRKSVFELIIDDGTARLHCRWWNLPYMQNYFAQGDEVVVFGKPLDLKPRTIDHPETEVVDGQLEASIHLGRVVPVYPLTEGLPQRWLRSLVWRTLEEFGHALTEPWPPGLASDLPTRREAIALLHFPGELADAERARQRLALDELVELQTTLRNRRQALLSKAPGLQCLGDNTLIKPFLSRLGFRLTRAQVAVLRELRADLASGHPMRRLLQGDVGSGKTVVSACCALLALESGYSVALMAPTEILAAQHYATFKGWFEPLGISVQLHTGSHKTRRSDAEPVANAEPLLAGLEPSSPAVAHQESRSGAVLVIGTHALIADGFALENLGLVIIDEQHRFGVAQREQLVRKGRYPHLLVMTATPIPRTLGLTLYGDLDSSIIDELPAGRPPIQTFLRTLERLPKVWAFLKERLAEGRQAFVVLPRIEDAGKEVKAVKKEFEALEQQLAPYRVGLLHGRLSANERESTLQAFRANSVHVLLTTSLIEVGIDVPNATMMVIDSAEQFGLAQLHQLRGRIGRGAHASYCVVVAQAKSSEAQQRLQLFASTTDGFHLAEADLKLRGVGDLLGQEQSGIPPLRFADLAEDRRLVERAREMVKQMGLSSNQGAT